ncbi:MAG: hypothetical protein E5V25_11155 [Mesorhizobium sp.]|nr:MAG: hypothetical protein E5V25_11155 [Mesorhizobium sp.]TIX86456.1 MAG: hypothetical protein E5V21_00590 [Mesorhizobium sp.]
MHRLASCAAAIVEAKVPVNRTRRVPDAPDGISARGPKQNTSKSAPGHKVLPYLLRGMTTDRRW